MGHVDAEAIDAAVEPEAEDVVESFADGLVVPVEVGLRGVEQVEIPLAGRAVRVLETAPGRAPEDGFPVVRWQFAVIASAVGEVVERSLWAARLGGECALEPLVLGAGVVRDQVHDHLDAAFVEDLEEELGIVEVTEEGVDRLVVGDVVARVLHG